MAKWVCAVCGYVHEGPEPPEKCPQCNAPASKFNELKEGAGFACEHQVGIIDGVSEDIIADLRANFNGECSEVGMYLAMARVADREGYPEISAAFTKYAFEELDLHRVEASTLTDNEKSKRVLLGCGFKMLGVNEDYLYINGKWQDHITFYKIK